MWGVRTTTNAEAHRLNHLRKEKKEKKNETTKRRTKKWCIAFTAIWETTLLTSDCYRANFQCHRQSKIVTSGSVMILCRFPLHWNSSMFEATMWTSNNVLNSLKVSLRVISNVYHVNTLFAIRSDSQTGSVCLIRWWLSCQISYSEATSHHANLIPFWRWSIPSSPICPPWHTATFWNSCDPKIFVVGFVMMKADWKVRDKYLLATFNVDLCECLAIDVVQV